MGAAGSLPLPPPAATKHADGRTFRRPPFRAKMRWMICNARSGSRPPGDVARPALPRADRCVRASLRAPAGMSSGGRLADRLISVGDIDAGGTRVPILAGPADARVQGLGAIEPIEDILAP